MLIAHMLVLGLGRLLLPKSSILDYELRCTACVDVVDGVWFRSFIGILFDRLTDYSTIDLAAQVEIGEKIWRPG